MRIKKIPQIWTHLIRMAGLAAILVFAMAAAVFADEPNQKAVRFAYSYDGAPQIAQTDLTVGWFSLTPYGLGDFDTYASTQQPTVLHALIRMHENLYGTSAMSNLTIGGTPGSMFITEMFAQESYNLMYYVNHAFPVMEPGWGATADTVQLQNGMVIDYAMFQNWDFWTYGSFLTFGLDEIDMTPTGSTTLSVYGVPTYAGMDGTTPEAEDIYDATLKLLKVTNAATGAYTTLWSGTAGNYSLNLASIESQIQQTDSTFSFQAGDSYVLAAYGEYAGTSSAYQAPAFAKLSIVSGAVSVTGVDLNVPANTQLHAYETYPLQPVITPSTATNYSVSYQSSNTSAATVSTTGVVTAHPVSSPADVTITCTVTQGGNTYTDTATFRILVGTSASSVTLDHNYMEIPSTSLTGTLNATLLPTNASNTTVVFTPYLSGSNSVALVGYQTGSNHIGIVHPQGATGTVLVKAAAQMDSSLYDTCMVAVGGVLGDADGDGEVTDDDVAIVTAMSNDSTIQNVYFEFLDLDDDGEITSYDVDTVTGIYEGSIVPYVVTG
jgi:hypothetical protein